MKVILRKNVPNVGSKHDIKDVSDGYAQNFLIRRGLADVATPERIAKAQRSAEHTAQEKEATTEALKSGIASLKDGVTITAKANEQGHLFEGVHEDDIADALSKNMNVAVNAGSIVLDAAIKEVGEHTAAVKVGTESLKVTVVVVASE